MMPCAGSGAPMPIRTKRITRRWSGRSRAASYQRRASGSSRVASLQKAIGLFDHPPLPARDSEAASTRAFILKALSMRLRFPPSRPPTLRRDISRQLAAEAKRERMRMKEHAWKAKRASATNPISKRFKAHAISNLTLSNDRLMCVRKPQSCSRF
jgi:hypothetical protein